MNTPRRLLLILVVLAAAWAVAGCGPQRATPTAVAEASPTPPPIPSPVVITDTPAPTLPPTATTAATATTAPTQVPRATSTPRPTVTPLPSETPRPTSTPRPPATSTPRPTSTRVPTSTPRPTSTARPTSTSTPTHTPTPTVTPTPGPLDVQLVRNSSFEKDDNKDGIPNNWSDKNLTKDDRRGCSRSHTGDCSFKLNGDGDTRSLNQSRTFAGKKGDEITFRVWARAEGATNIFARLTIYYKDGTSDNFVIDASGTYDWTRYRQTIIAARAYERIRVSLRTEAGSGTVWFDDVTVRVYREP